MSRGIDPRAAVDQAFREHALVLGGLAALGRVSDEVVWQLAHSLRASRIRALRRLRIPMLAGGDAGVDCRPHPAIAQFLRSLGER